MHKKENKKATNYDLDTNNYHKILKYLEYLFNNR